MNKNKKEKILIITGIFIIILFIFFYKIGYRIGPGISIGKVGVVNINVPFKETNIFVDGKNKFSSSKENDVLNIKLSPGKYSVIVSKEGYFPWNKDLYVKSNDKISISPIFVSKNPSGEIINEIDPEYWKIKNLIEQNKLPTKNSPIISSDGKTKVWIESNSIMSEMDGKIKTVITPEFAIKNISFYKNRSDAIIFSSADSVNMIEIDSENFQNFMPIYKGNSPRFVETDQNFIYIDDNSVLMLVVI